MYLTRGISTTRTEVFPLSKLKHDYLLVIYEFSEQKQAYQSILMYRVRITKKIDSNGESVNKITPSAFSPANSNVLGEELFLKVLSWIAVSDIPRFPPPNISTP